MRTHSYHFDKEYLPEEYKIVECRYLPCNKYNIGACLGDIVLIEDTNGFHPCGFTQNFRKVK